MILIFIIIALIIFLFMNLQETFFPTPKYKLIENFATSISGHFIFPIMNTNGSTGTNKFFNPTLNGGTTYYIQIDLNGTSTLPTYFCVTTTTDVCTIPKTGYAFISGTQNTTNYMRLSYFNIVGSTGYNNLVNNGTVNITCVVSTSTSATTITFNLNTTEFKNELSAFFSAGSNDALTSLNTGSNNALASKVTGSTNALGSKVTGSTNALNSKVTGSKAVSCGSGYTKVTINKESKCVNCTQFGGTLSTSLSDGYYINATGNKIQKKTDIINYPICTLTCPDPTSISGLDGIGTLQFNQTKSILNFCSSSGFVCATGYKKSGTTCILDTTTLTCAPNYTYNSPSNTCVPNSSCPSGYIPNGIYCQSICVPGYNNINGICQPTCPTNTILKKDSKGVYYCEYNIPGTDNFNFIFDNVETVDIIAACTINQLATKKSDGSITCTNVDPICPIYKGVQTTLKKDSNGNNYCWFNSCGIDETLNTTTNKCQKICDLNYTFVPGANNTYSCKPTQCPNTFVSIPDPSRSNYYKCSAVCPKPNIGKLTLSGNLCVLDTSTPICSNKYTYDSTQGKCITTQNFNILSTSPVVIGNAL